MSLREFFAMGGYALYVWPAYLVTLTLLAFNVWAARSAHRRARAEARRRLEMQAEMEEGGR